MSDLVERLERYVWDPSKSIDGPMKLCTEAADRIEALEAAIREHREAMHASGAKSEPDDQKLWSVLDAK